MATYNVSNASGLTGALSKAKSGDVIKLGGGSYGTVNFSGKNLGGVTITSASDSNQAVFTKVKFKGVSGVTIDNVKFDGPGNSGNGLEISNGSNIKVVNSDFTELRLGAYFSKVTGLTVSNNNFTKMYHDAMNFAGITNGVISNNVYRESGSQQGYTHKDFIQFWTNKTNGEVGSKNITITGNSFYSKGGDDHGTHGILIMNEAKLSAHTNFTISNNYIRGAHTHGITVQDGNDFDIVNNTLVRDGKWSPLINVTPKSVYVTITNNTVGSVPDQGNSTWVVANNKEVGAVGKHWTGGQSGSTVVNKGSAGATTNAVAEATETPTASTISSPSSDGNGKADHIRFDESKIGKTTTSTVQYLDFDEGDTLVFINYDKDSFHDKPGGNVLHANTAGTYVKIDSIADIKELADFGGNKVTASANATTDVLTVKIDQGDHVHTVHLTGLADEYLAL